jgi:hypothetical protein
VVYSKPSDGLSSVAVLLRKNEHLGAYLLQYVNRPERTGRKYKISTKKTKEMKKNHDEKDEGWHRRRGVATLSYR